MTVLVPIGNVKPEEGVQVGVNDPLTRSEDVGGEKVTTFPVGLVVEVKMSGLVAIVGGVVSCTVTVNVPVALLLAASVAVQVTGVEPKANVEPEAGTQDIVTGLTVSVAVGKTPTSAPEGLVASTVISGGIVMEGGVVSCTFTDIFS